MRTQARPIVLVLAAVVLSGGCGSKTSSEAREASGSRSGDIVFAVNREGWNEIWVMDASGENRHRLTDPMPPGADAAGNMSPVWSPEGDRIAFVSSGDEAEEDEDRLELYVMDVDSGEARRLTKNGALDTDPDWSPDGKRIAFVRAEGWGTKQVEMSLRVIDNDGSGEQTLLDEDGPIFLRFPAWSPDGKRIAFSRSIFSEKSFESALLVMRSDGSNLVKIADEAGEPAWSPDGSRLAFASYIDRSGETCFHECDPSSEIYVADGDGANVKRLTRDKANDTSPTWSPDGKRIMFSSDRSNPPDHEVELYVMPASGGDPERLTRNKVWDLQPDWRSD